MSEICETPYGTWVSVYRERGFYPRRLISSPDPRTGKKRGKACLDKGWEIPDPELPPGTLEKWDKHSEEWNIGLQMGSPFPDGSRLGALDVDNDNYVRLAKSILGQPICGRIGKKGIAYFFRYFTQSSKPKVKYRVHGELVAEVFLEKAQVVIPPSIHPDTGEPYRWVGKPLHEIDFKQLPLIEV